MAITHHRPYKLAKIKGSLDSNDFARSFEKAQYSLGLFEGSQKGLENTHLLISPLTAKEAAVSSKIEGTVSTVSDVFLFEAGGEPKHSDTLQVRNYRTAMNFAIEELLRGRKIGKGLIKDMHGILLRGVRHKGGLGKFRNCPVWIAEKETDPIEKAIYVPPEAHKVEEYIEDLIKYLKESEESALVKAGIAHYQFEAIHPFEDGNGRIGRLLIPLIIYQEGLLSQPILYLSGYFEENRDLYLEALHRVDRTNDYESWLDFYLGCVASQLKTTQELVESIYKLYGRLKKEMHTKSPFYIDLLDFIFKMPIFTIPEAQSAIKTLTRVPVTRLIDSFKKKGYITELDVRVRRAKLFRFNPLLEILK